MFTTARVVGEERPAAFFIDVRRRLEERSAHLRVTHEWDGVGMKGTQSERRRAGIRAKTATAELAKSSLRRMTNVLGGGTFSQRSPFAHWFEDVRALGFLRPPWGLAFDTLFRTSQD